MSKHCHYGCEFGRRCLGETREEVIEWLRENGIAADASWSDDRLDEMAAKFADVDVHIPHVRRAKGAA